MTMPTTICVECERPAHLTLAGWIHTDSDTLTCLDDGGEIGTPPTFARPTCALCGRGESDGPVEAADGETRVTHGSCWHNEQAELAADAIAERQANAADEFNPRY